MSLRQREHGWDHSRSFIIGATTMPDESRPTDKQKLLEFATDSLGESRNEFVAKLAYKLWVQRGAPSGFTGHRLVA
jgi:hypothetical protein